MPKSRSQRARPEERAVTIQKFRSSGLTQKAFCNAEGLAISTFQNWLKNGVKLNLAALPPLKNGVQLDYIKPGWSFS